MQTVTEIELDQILKNHQNLIGGEFRQFRFDEKVLQLQLLKNDQLTWICFAMKPGNPFLFFSSHRISLVKNLKKPLALFLKTHFDGAQLVSLGRVADLGRVVQLGFEVEQGDGQILLSLIPGRVNAEIKVNEKSVFAFKPKSLERTGSESQTAMDRPEHRENTYFENQWESRFAVKEAKAPGGDGGKALAKKRSGLDKMKVKIEAQLDDQWARLGDWLKSNQSFDELPEVWRDRVDLQKNLAWNIENCFTQSKKNKSKIEGTQERIKQLEKEISQMEKGVDLKPEKQAAASLLKLADIKGKTLKTADGRVFVGKSGSENLKLLRKAKPWYIWMHIKDYPGAYGILERIKGKEPSAQSLQEAARAVVRQSLPQGTKGLFEVIYAECRYVRPIKGAKSGQVTYSHEKVMGIKVDE